MYTIPDLIKANQPLPVIEAQLDLVKEKICDEYCKKAEEEIACGECPLDLL